MTNREELFFTLFKPEVGPIWTGNLKRFKLGQQLDGNGNPVDLTTTAPRTLPLFWTSTITWR